MFTSISKFLCYVAILGILLSCAENDDPDVVDYKSYKSSYDLIQGAIWDRQCISCHTAGSSFARQSDLVLTEDVSYDQLVNRAPNNKAAVEDGLELVGTKGLESLAKSYLWEKINALDIDHFYGDHPEYGSLMPLGGDFLTNGELEFIRKWIIEGAPRDGKVADIKVLEDETRFVTSPFEPLEPPASGYQFHIEPFEVKPNRDREIFIYQNLFNTEPIFVNRVEIAMSPGSHHFILYNFSNDFPQSAIPGHDDLRDLYDNNGNPVISTLVTMQYHQFVAGTQWPNMNYKFPEGVALKLPANTGFDLNSHYANRSDESIMGEVYANVHTVQESEVEHIAEILWLNNTRIKLPPKQVTTLKRSFPFERDVNVFQLWSHAHEHMTEFRVYIEGGSRDGELIYVTFDWEHPPILQMDPPLLMKEGESFRLEATYDNYENRELGFGLLSTDEMMMLFGAYY